MSEANASDVRSIIIIFLFSLSLVIDIYHKYRFLNKHYLYRYLYRFLRYRTVPNSYFLVQQIISISQQIASDAALRLLA